MLDGFWKSKGFFWGIIILVVGVVGYLFYVTQTAKDTATAAASNLENGGIGTAIGSNIGTTIGSLWTSLKSAFTSSPPGAIPGSSTTLTS